MWHVDAPYHRLPGYYYLHRNIPFYDRLSGRLIDQGPDTIAASVSHIVSSDPDLEVPGYSVERTFGEVRVWRRDASEPPVRRWRSYAIVHISPGAGIIMRTLAPDAPLPPADWGIRFADDPP